jgi:hypothetical protein
VANRIVKKFAMKDMRELVGDLSQTNHYMVSFSTLNSTLMSYIQKRIGFQEDVRNFLSRKTGLLCSEASLPTSSLATGEVRDDFMGIPQEFAHTRLYTDIDFTFYVDTNYVNLKIFESWMDYITGGSEAEISELDDNYYRRMNYPDNYKVQTMFISKFERDFNSQIDYQFINAFPKLVTAIPVSYGAADLLKVSVQFTYDRYIVNPRGSIKKSNSSGFNDIARVSNNTTATTAPLPSTGSTAADEYLEENRNSLLNNSTGNTEERSGLSFEAPSNVQLSPEARVTRMLALSDNQAAVLKAIKDGKITDDNLPLNAAGVKRTIEGW